MIRMVLKASRTPVVAEATVRAHAKAYPLRQANETLADLPDGRLAGAAVLRVQP